MNTKGEKINIEEIIKSVRQLYMPDLMALLRSDIMKFWSWGSHAFKAESNDYSRYFRMTVSGHHHKGHVWIFLNGLDLFDVYYTSRQGTIKDIQTDLYFDMLVEAIDNKIERIAEYTD